MSTRAQVVIEENEGVFIYKHSDGYPSGVLPILQKLLPKFKDGRGFDPEYLTAHVSSTFIIESIEADKKRAKEWKKKGLEYERWSDFLGHGLGSDVHGDIEYLYYIRKDFSIDILHPTKLGVKNARKMRTVTLEELKALKCPLYSKLSLETLSVVH